MARTPLEALDDHITYEGAHQLVDKWRRVEETFRKQERAIQENADAIAAIRTNLDDLTLACAAHWQQYRRDKAKMTDQPVAAPPRHSAAQRTDWQIKAGERIVKRLVEFDALSFGLAIGKVHPDIASLIAREIIDEEDKALGLRDMHDRAALRSLRKEVVLVLNRAAHYGAHTTCTHVLALIDAKLEEGTE